MRVWLGSLMVLASACADEASGPSACDVGPSIYQSAVNALSDGNLACDSDDDCVVFSAGLQCAGFSVAPCANVVHRDAAAQWDEAKLCQEIESESSPSHISCDLEASCIAAGKPVCRASRCVGDR